MGRPKNTTPMKQYTMWTTAVIYQKAKEAAAFLSEQTGRKVSVQRFTEDALVEKIKRTAKKML